MFSTLLNYVIYCLLPDKSLSSYLSLSHLGPQYLAQSLKYSS